MASTAALETSKRAVSSGREAERGGEATAAATAAALPAESADKRRRARQREHDNNNNNNNDDDDDQGQDQDQDAQEVDVKPKHRQRHEPAEPVTAPQPKRRRVAEDARVRSAKACQRCRRLKEKCDGRQPCVRCQRSGRDCEFAPPGSGASASLSAAGAGAGAGGAGSHARSVASSTASRHSASANVQLGILADAALGRDGQAAAAAAAAAATATATATATTARHEERTRCLERLVQHLLGDVPTDLNNLRRMVDKAGQRAGSKSDAGSVKGGAEDLDDLTLEDENFTVKALSQSTTHYSGEFSHWNFSQKLRRRLSQCMDSNMSLPSSFARDTLRSGAMATPSSSSLSSLSSSSPSSSSSSAAAAASAASAAAAAAAANRLLPRAKANANMRILEYWRATQLQSPKQLVQSVLSCLPPRAVSNFLVHIYFQFAQVNCFYVEDAWLRKKLDFLYEAPGHVTSEDSGWVCSVLMVLAIGTQFAHMAAGPPPPPPHDVDDDDNNNNDNDGPARHHYHQQHHYHHHHHHHHHQKQAIPPTAMGMAGGADADVGVTFYQMASKLIPDIITIASLESVQACLLLAHYALPLDTSGLAYTYLGLGIKMAIQNGMHRRYTGSDLDAWTIETRNRLWWTAYTVERRVSVLHGRPASIAPTEVDAELPKDATGSGQLDEPSRFKNMSAFIDMTLRLSDAANAITLLRRCPKNLQQTYFERVVDVCQSLHAWWATLPAEAQNPSPSSPMFRSHVHLQLCLHLNDIFVGRPFIFSSAPTGTSPAASMSSPGAASVCASASRRPDTSDSSPKTTTGANDSSKPPAHPHPRPRSRAALVARAVQAAIHVIHLLHTLHTTTGLARSSYTEFSSCRAALLVMLAQSVNSGPQSEAHELKDAIDSGMVLIRGMAAGNVSTQSETSVIEALEIAVRRLHEMQQQQQQQMQMQMQMQSESGREGGEGNGEGDGEGGELRRGSRSGNGAGGRDGGGEGVGDGLDVGKSGYARFREWASLWPVSGTVDGQTPQHQYQLQHQHQHQHQQHHITHQHQAHHQQQQQQQQQQHQQPHGRVTPSMAFATMRTPPFYNNNNNNNNNNNHNMSSSSMDRGLAWMPNSSGGGGSGGSGGGGGGGGGNSSLVEHSPESSKWLNMVDSSGLGIGIDPLEDLGLFGGFPELGALDGWPGLS